MANIPDDLKKVHQKYEQLVQEKGIEFAMGFIDYMVQVDYHNRDPEEALRSGLTVAFSSAFSHEIEEMMNGNLETDYVKGFEFAKAYSQQANYTYTS